LDALLLKIQVKLELITNVEVLDIIDRTKGGGLCFVGAKRHVKFKKIYAPGCDEMLKMIICYIR
jgi:purine nucleoside phosphorylase